MQELYQSQVLHNKPRVEIIDNFIDVSMCAHLIEASYDKLERAQVVGGNNSILSEVRTGSNFFLRHDYSERTKELGERISKMVNIPLSHAEQYQIIYYGENQEYKPHFDSFDTSTDVEWNNLAPSGGGQRILTFLMYLNTVEEGGGTIFPELDLIVQAKQGRIVIFEDVLPGTITPHPLALHGGMPVIKGEKWAVNLWFHEKERKYL
jgi:prolyl 4-hydroxylase